MCLHLMNSDNFPFASPFTLGTYIFQAVRWINENLLDIYLSL